MNTITKKKTKKPIYLLVAIILLITLLAAAMLNWRNMNIPDTSNRQRADEAKAGLSEFNGSESKKLGIPSDTTRTSEDIPVSTALKLSNVTVTQKDGNVTASGVTNGDGTCVFQYTSEYDRPVIEQVVVKDGKCISNISEISFSRLGDWALKVTYYNGNSKTEVEQNVTIR